MAIFTLSTFGLQPIGALQAGAVGQRFGVSTPLFVGGIICILVGVVATRAKRGKLDEL
jgi:fluoride ion exporter CrcB/FEX